MLLHTRISSQRSAHTAWHPGLFPAVSLSVEVQSVDLVTKWYAINTYLDF